ncbi:MAG: site-specific integrase [Methanothrix sp.]|nr:site-specific integrase [Methanothrix sp.]
MDIRDSEKKKKKKLLDLASGMDRIILLIINETGLRLEDLIPLSVSDVDLESGSLLIAPHRKIHISPQAMAEIKDYLKTRPGQRYLLEGRCGKPITCKWKRCVLEPLQRKAEKETNIV